MNDPWNNVSIQAPSVNTYKSDEKFNLQPLLHTCNNAIKVLSKQSPLHREAAITSRFVYKFDKKFRNDIGYRNLKKVNTALRKYLSLNMLKDIENYLSLLPTHNNEFYLPTRQMLEYVMVRFLSFSKIMLRICICSKQAAIFYLDRVKRGESHWMSLMPYALLSRIWSMSMVLLQRSCSWYTNAYPFLTKFKLKGMNFLQTGYNLPKDIEEFLDIKNLDNFGRFEWSQRRQIQFDQLLIEDKEGDMLENILEFVDKINDDNYISDDTIKIKAVVHDSIDRENEAITNMNVDHGEKISRDIFKSFFKTETPSQIHSADRVTDKESLYQFIIAEEKYRNGQNNQSLTSHLSFMQWLTLKNSLLSLHKSLARNRKIERKFQKVWKEQCLDYK